MMVLYFKCSALNPICSWMSAEGHHVTPASHIAGDNYHGPITGDTVVIGGRGNTYNLGQGRSPSLSRVHHLSEDHMSLSGAKTLSQKLSRFCELCLVGTLKAPGSTSQKHAFAAREHNFSPM